MFGKQPKLELPKLDTLQKLYDDSWISDWYDTREQLEEYKQRGYAILKTFYEECEANHPKPKYLEEPFRLKVGNHVFAGKIDRADEGKDGLIIIDYKTGSSRPIEKVDREQLLIYQWAAADFLKEKVSDLQYWFFAQGLVKSSFVGTDLELADLKEELEQTLEQMVKSISADDFYAQDLRISHECKYREWERSR